MRSGKIELNPGESTQISEIRFGFDGKLHLVFDDVNEACFEDMLDRESLRGIYAPDKAHLGGAFELNQTESPEQTAYTVLAALQGYGFCGKQAFEKMMRFFDIATPAATAAR